MGHKFLKTKIFRVAGLKSHTHGTRILVEHIILLTKSSARKRKVLKLTSEDPEIILKGVKSKVIE